MRGGEVFFFPNVNVDFKCENHNSKDWITKKFDLKKYSDQKDFRVQKIEKSNFNHY